MFKDAKIGDKVFDYILQEWGNVIRFNDLSIYPVEVKFSDCVKNYTVLGKQQRSNKLPVLFWDEVEPIIPPEKPLPKLEVDTPVLVWLDATPDAKFKRYFSHFDSEGNIYCFASGSTSWSADGKTTPWKHWELAK